MESIDPNSHLQHDLIYEILINLPVKSLIRFKCVSKGWFALISQSKFIKSHHKRSTEQPYTMSRQRLLVLASKNIRSVSCDRVFSESFSGDIKFDSLDVGFPFHENDGRLYSCKGLVCVFFSLSSDSDIYMWNPATRCHRKLPISPKPESSCYCSLFVTFGYDQITDDYKVVRQIYNMGTHPPTYLFEVFSLKAGKWRTITYPIGKFRILIQSAAAFLNGTIHWPLTTDIKTWTIGVFDLETERFCEISLPEDLSSLDINIILTGVVVLKECLCASIRNMNNENIELWMMKEYNVKESWTKLASIHLDTPQRNAPRMYPLFRSETTSEALVLASVRWWYNKNIYVFINLQNETRTLFGDFSMATIHVENLVSPYGSNVIDAAGHQHPLQ